MASLLLGVGAQVLLSRSATREAGDRNSLLKLDEHASEALAGAIVQGLSALFLAGVLLYLLRCARHRRETSIPPAIGGLVMVAPALITVGLVLNQLEVIDIAERFAGSGARSEARADDLLDDRGSLPVFFTYAGYLALGFGLVVVNLNAMRVGLMTRFIGIIGIVVGALYVLPIFAGPLIIQIFWLGALVAIFMDRWPGGRGEAWETAEAGVWLSAAEQRRQAMREAKIDEAQAGLQPGGEREAPEDLDARPHPVSKKRRKRKQ